MKNQCGQLNGDVRAECGTCTSAAGAACWPGASDFPPGTAQIAVGAAGRASIAPVREGGAIAKPCRKITAAELSAAESDAARAALLSEPTIVTGLVDEWPTASWLADLQFDNVDPTSLDQAARLARSGAEAAILERLQREYAVPAALRRASSWRVLSYGLGQTGVHITPNHGFAWLGLLNGSKVWHLAPPTEPAPDEYGCLSDYGPECSQDWERCMAAGCTHSCRQSTREVVIVPTGWWHSTCNAPGPTVGIGGQDRCDALDDGTPGCRLRYPAAERLLNQQGVSGVCPDASRAAACHGELGLSVDATVPPRLLQPDLQVSKVPVPLPALA